MDVPGWLISSVRTFFVFFSFLCSTCLITGPKMSVGQFLQKLPKSVIKDGKVIDIRDAVGENFRVREGICYSVSGGGGQNLSQCSGGRDVEYVTVVGDGSRICHFVERIEVGICHCLQFNVHTLRKVYCIGDRGWYVMETD